MEKDNLDMDTCIGPVLTNNIKPKKWGEQFFMTKWFCCKILQEEKSKVTGSRTYKMIKELIFFQDILNNSTKNYKPFIAYYKSILDQCSYSLPSKNIRKLCFIIFLWNIQNGNWYEELLRGIWFIKNTKKILLNFMNLLFMTIGGKLLLFG